MGQNRIEPAASQESVWDYPRPPRVEETARHVQVFFNGEVIADTRRAKRVLETSHPPVYYIPPQDVRMECLTKAGRRTWCEWKGQAGYYSLSVGSRRVEDAAWFYPRPTPGYEAIQGHVAFYPAKMDACYVDGERVQAQPGDFYGGWITSEIVGPFKGGPGTMGW
ncbi:MAG: DUF427 domain-containing protein [Anaerolineae bacterium]|jgi:uncharacterized protein (DUF427 family)